MSIVEPTPPDPSWPRYSAGAFPRYRFVPGLTPHPRRHPQGHAYGTLAVPPPRLDPGQWPENDVYREELFGPVAQVYRVPSEEDAVELANDTPFGLGSYVMTNDAEQAERVADQIDAGMVYVNIVGADSAELPFGGTKRSGFGRELGRYGADEFVNKKLIRVS
jgi:acyl-CoA reductase-like NAD-dependent aldehyde dehydrogenase